MKTALPPQEHFKGGVEKDTKILVLMQKNFEMFATDHIQNIHGK